MATTFRLELHCILHSHINRHIMFISTQKERAPNSVMDLTVSYIKFADQNALSRVLHIYLTVLCVYLITSNNCYKLHPFHQFLGKKMVNMDEERVKFTHSVTL